MRILMFSCLIVVLGEIVVVLKFIKTHYEQQYLLKRLTVEKLYAATKLVDFPLKNASNKTNELKKGKKLNMKCVYLFKIILIKICFLKHWINFVFLGIVRCLWQITKTVLWYYWKNRIWMEKICYLNVFTFKLFLERKDIFVAFAVLKCLQLINKVALTTSSTRKKKWLDKWKNKSLKSFFSSFHFLC